MKLSCNKTILSLGKSIQRSRVLGAPLIRSFSTQQNASNNSRKNMFMGVATVAGLSLGGFALYEFRNKPIAQMYAKSDASAKKEYLAKMPKGHIPRPELPFFTIDQVKSHTTPEDHVWVTYKGGVYDVTDFAAGHPGGIDRIHMIGGTDLAIYWDVYKLHYREKVIEFMEKYRIGNLSPDDAIKMETEFEFPDSYDTDPVRPDSDLLHTLEKPFCGEPKLKRLAENFYTPNDLHYVRLHLPVPTIDPKKWSVTVNGLGIKGEFVFTLEDLKTKFKHHTLACTLQCAGNRREDFNRGTYAVFISPNWRVSAISNAKYKGVLLRDILKYCGLDVETLHNAEVLETTIRHVLFEGEDSTEAGTNYGISIPIEKAVDPRGDVMLVWEMNDLPLPPDHGHPVRALVPGFVGNKSCKFIKEITLSDKISGKPWHCKSYRNFPPNVTFEEHLSNWGKLPQEFLQKGPICYMMPVQSIVSQPTPGTTIGAENGKLKSIKLKGVSWTGNGVGMARVDLSIDGGKTWLAADFLPKPKDVEAREAWNRQWSWFIFEKEFPLSEDMKKQLAAGKPVTLDVVSKGVDNSFNVQPERFEPYYNARGVVINEWYHVPVILDPKMRLGTMKEVEGEDALNPPTGGHFMREWKDAGWGAPEASWHEEVIKKSQEMKAKAK